LYRLGFMALGRPTLTISKPLDKIASARLSAPSFEKAQARTRAEGEVDRAMCAYPKTTAAPTVVFPVPGGP